MAVQDICNSIKKIPQNCTGDYQIIHYIRIATIAISVVALLFNIFIIIKKKQYTKGSIKLFMFVQIYYVISLVSVIPHGINFHFDLCQPFKDINTIQIYQCMIQDGITIYSAVQAYINLTFYALSYWYAILITLYITCQIKKTHKRFMKQRKIQIIFVCCFIFLWYLTPFIFSFYQDMPFSFGPTGYSWDDKKYYLYSGIINRQQDNKSAFAEVILISGFLPVSMFIYHLFLLNKVKVAEKKLKKQNQLDPTQVQIIRSGDLSWIVFFVQIFNLIKFIMFLFVDDIKSQGYYIFLYIINTIFDFLALLLVCIYFKFYYRYTNPQQVRISLLNSSMGQNI